MKFNLKLYALILISLVALAKAQNIDTLAVVRVENLLLQRPDTLLFDVRLYRNSDAWSRWANGTFELALPDSIFKLDTSSVLLEYISGTSQLNVQPITGQLPTDSYYITPRIINDRISITVAGPEEFVNATAVPADTGLLIGTFQISTKNGEFIPLTFKWLQPQYYYQACAYKLESDSIVQPGNIIWFTSNDNVEMDDGSVHTTVRYEVEPAPESYVKLKYFDAVYEGQRKVSFDWETETEKLNRGFIIRRGILPFGSKDTQSVAYKDFTASYAGGFGKPPAPEMIGLGSKNYGKKYHYEFDTVPFRGEIYCWALYYEDFYGKEHFLAYDCEKIPNSVITFAQANPNPMSFSTTIEYALDDDVLLECNVYDLLGKRLTTLVSMSQTDMGKMGSHKVTFDAPREDFATQGMYNVIFLAHPLDDPGVEISKAIVKVQLIR